MLKVIFFTLSLSFSLVAGFSQNQKKGENKVFKIEVNVYDSETEKRLEEYTIIINKDGKEFLKYICKDSIPLIVEIPIAANYTIVATAPCKFSQKLPIDLGIPHKLFDFYVVNVMGCGGRLELNEIQFKSRNSVRLTKYQKRKLDTIAKMNNDDFIKSQVKLKINGHVGIYENDKIGQKRIEKVKNYLIKKGWNEEKISTENYKKKFHKVDSLDCDKFVREKEELKSCLQINRRVDFQLYL